MGKACVRECKWVLMPPHTHTQPPKLTKADREKLKREEAERKAREEGEQSIYKYFLSDCLLVTHALERMLNQSVSRLPTWACTLMISHKHYMYRCK